VKTHWLGDADLNRRHRAVIRMGWALVASTLLFLGLTLVRPPAPEWGLASLLVLLALALGGAMYAARRGFVRAAGLGMTLVVLLGVTLAPFVSGRVDFAPFFVVVAVVVAAVALEPRDVFVTIGLGGLSLAVTALASRGFSTETQLPGSAFLNGVILFAVLSAVAAMMAVGVRRLLDDLSRREREAQEARERARQADARAQIIAENTSDLLTLLDSEGRVVWASPSHQRVLAVSKSPSGPFGAWAEATHFRSWQRLFSARRTAR
jgi:PAS domain-containing protein